MLHGRNICAGRSDSLRVMTDTFFYFLLKHTFRLRKVNSRHRQYCYSSDGCVTSLVIALVFEAGYIPLIYMVRSAFGWRFFKNVGGDLQLRGDASFFEKPKKVDRHRCSSIHDIRGFWITSEVGLLVPHHLFVNSLGVSLPGYRDQRFFRFCLKENKNIRLCSCFHYFGSCLARVVDSGAICSQ